VIAEACAAKGVSFTPQNLHQVLQKTVLVHSKPSPAPSTPPQVCFFTPPKPPPNPPKDSFFTPPETPPTPPHTLDPLLTPPEPPPTASQDSFFDTANTSTNSPVGLLTPPAPPPTRPQDVFDTPRTSTNSPIKHKVVFDFFFFVFCYVCLDSNWNENMSDNHQVSKQMKGPVCQN
jgi:hypothetical protein